MANEQFKILQNIVESRRSVSWAKMNGKPVDDRNITALLKLAHWAPTHGRTEPWQFFVYAREALKTFGQAHGNLYWDHTPEDKRMQATKDKLTHNVDLASHLVIAVMKRGMNEKIPMHEEMAAASAAVQNILLGAQALGIASFWSTGGMTHKQALKDHLGLQQEDIVLGLLFLGYTDEPAKEGVRNSHIDQKVKWM